MPLLSTPQQLHDVQDIEAHCRATVKRTLARNGGYLSLDQHDELLAYLLHVAYRLSRFYDKDRSSLSFSTFCSQICSRRVVDWYRKEFGDNRYGKRPKTESLEAVAASTGRSIAEVIGTTTSAEQEEVLTRVALSG